MKPTHRMIMTALALFGMMVACAMPGSNASPGTVSPDAVNTAIAGTQQAQALAQATVNANVLTSMPATPTPGPTVDYVTLTEEELTNLIDQSVNEAVAATEQTTAAVESATSDGTVTQEEVEDIYAYYYAAEYAIEQTEAAMTAYTDAYALLANEMLAEMTAIEAELNQMYATMSEISTSLTEISTTLAQGLAVAEETISQLEAAAQQAQTQVGELKAQAQDIKSTLQTDQQNRLDQISQIQPNNIPTDRLAALQSGFQFLDEAKAALGDNKLSRDELTNLAQLGANAQAGFANFGGAGLRDGPDLSQFSGKFGEITTQLARGQMPQARGNLDQFERGLGQRPSGSGLPGGGLPGGGLPGPRP
jgi:hypothetical protein